MLSSAGDRPFLVHTPPILPATAAHFHPFRSTRKTHPRKSITTAEAPRIDWRIFYSALLSARREVESKTLSGRRADTDVHHLILRQGTRDHRKILTRSREESKSRDVPSTDTRGAQVTVHSQPLQYQIAVTRDTRYAVTADSIRSGSLSNSV